jgi:hypothetical protein
MNLAKRICSPKLSDGHLICGIASLMLYLLLATSTAFAQFTAGVQGNIQDAGGANIPAAQMTIVDTATKVQQSAQAMHPVSIASRALVPESMRSPRQQRASHPQRNGLR